LRNLQDNAMSNDNKTPPAAQPASMQKQAVPEGYVPISDDLKSVFIEGCGEIQLAWPTAQPALVRVIPLLMDSKQELRQDKDGQWGLYSYGGLIRWLNVFECNFVNSALSAAAQPAPVQEPVAAECKFDREQKWGRCEIAHHNLVQSEPHNWPGYQTRLLYTTPPAQPAPVQPEVWAMAFIEKMLETTPAHSLLASQVFHALRQKINAPVLPATPPAAQPATVQAQAVPEGYVPISDDLKSVCIEGCGEIQLAWPTAQPAPVQPAAMTFDEAWASLSWSKWRMRPVKELVAELHRLTTPPAQPAYKDSTPALSVGDSSFESWYEQHLVSAPVHQGHKQRARDAYAAGMGDPLVAPAARQAKPQVYGWVRMNGQFNSGVFHLGRECPTGWVNAAEPVSLIVAADLGDGLEGGAA
jgi:hypothetical protein